MPAKKPQGGARLTGQEKLARALAKPGTLSGAVTGLDQTPRVFRLATVVSLSPFTVVFNDDPAGSTIVGLPALRQFTGPQGTPGSPAIVDAPLVGDGSTGSPLDLALASAGGLGTVADELSIKLDPATDPTCGSLSASGLLISCGSGSGGTVEVVDPITGDGSIGDPLGLALASDAGLDVVGGELTILLDPATDPSAASLSAAGLLITGAGGGGGGGPTSAVTHQDNFNRADESPVTAGAIGDPPAHSGAYRVVSNELASDGSVGENLCWWTSPTPDFDFEIAFPTLPSDGGVIFGLDAYGDNYLLLNYAPADGSVWKLYQRRGGFSLITNPAGAGANGDVIKVSVRNGQFEIFLNSVSYIDSTTLDIARFNRAPFGNAGLRLNTDTTARADDMTMTSYFQCCGGGSGSGDLYTIDSPSAFADAFGPDIGYDEEFNSDTNPTALPSGWTDINGNSGSYVERAGKGIWHIPSGFNTINQASVVVRDLPVESSWTAWGASHCAWMGMGLVLTDGTKAVGVVWNPNPLVLIATWSDIASAYYGNPAQENTGRIGHEYTRIEYNAANDISIAYGFDGHSWRYLINNYDFPTYMGGFTPTKIGFVMNQGSGPLDFAMDWFRVR